MSALITGDLHLTTNPQDEYRWKLFDWLYDQCKSNDNINELILLGDYTNPKDNHPSQLVNTFVSMIDMCADVFDTIILIAGNHDYIDPAYPFFMFLDKRKNNDVFFIKKPTDFALSIGHCLFIPAGADWNNLPDHKGIEYIFTHATFTGAISETGHRLTGVSTNLAEGIGVPIISGDIHKPQTISGTYIEYVGAPYHTRFGSDYEPHVMLLHNNHQRTYLKYPAPLKHTLTISSLDDLDKIPDNSVDHHKIRVHLSRGELTNWPEIQQNIKHLAKEKGINITGPELILNPEDKVVVNTKEVLSPEQLVVSYAQRHLASEEHIEIGKSLL